MKKEMIFALIIIFLLFSAIFLATNNKKQAINTVKIGETVINVQVASTDQEREQGLSGKESLADGQGLLFIFENEGYYGFWMKDMNFSIDIAWLDKNKKIIYIADNVSPASYPDTFYPTSPSLYVLEVPAGFLEKMKIEIGDSAKF